MRRWMPAAFLGGLGLVVFAAEKNMSLPFIDLGRFARLFPYDADLPPCVHFQNEESRKNGAEWVIDAARIPEDIRNGADRGLLVLEGGTEGPLTLRSITRGKTLVFQLEKAPAGAPPLHAVVLRADFLDRPSEFRLGSRRLELALDVVEPLWADVSFVPLPPEAAVGFLSGEKALHLIRSPQEGAMVFDEKAQALMVLSDPAKRIYGLQVWGRWTADHRREPRVVVQLMTPWNDDAARAYPRAALVPAGLLAVPGWEVRTGTENDSVPSGGDWDAAIRTDPSGKLVSLPVRRHEGPTGLKGEVVPFSPAEGLGGGNPAPGVKRICSAAGLDPSVYGKMDFSARELLAVSLGEQGTTGYSVQVQKIFSSAAGVDVHLLAPEPGPMTSVGEAITYPGCAVWVPRDLKGPWRFFKNGALWQVPLTVVE